MPITNDQLRNLTDQLYSLLPPRNESSVPAPIPPITGVVPQPPGQLVIPSNPSDTDENGNPVVRIVPAMPRPFEIPPALPNVPRPEGMTDEEYEYFCKYIQNWAGQFDRKKRFLDPGEGRTPSYIID